MSLAWEVSEDDIHLVLAKHGENNDHAFDVSQSVICEEEGRIEKAALRCNDIVDQTTSALDEIENILIENNILKAPKRFSAA